MSARATWSRAPWSIQLYAMLQFAGWIAGAVINPREGVPLAFRVYELGTPLLIIVLLLYGLFARNRFIWKVAVAWAIFGLCGPVLSLVFAGASPVFLVSGMNLVYLIVAAIELAVLLAPATKRWIERPMPPAGGEPATP